jgi:hypothetical protein
MKISDLSIQIDNNTFAPKYVCTLELPLELMMDSEALLGIDELERIIGKELILQLKQNIALRDKDGI